VLPLLGKGAGSPSNTKSPGPRPSSIPTDILIHAAIWPQQIWAENWGGLCPFGGGVAGSPSNTMWSDKTDNERPGHIVPSADPAPRPPKGHSPLQFSAHICCGKMAAWIKMPLGMELGLGLGSGDFVLDGDPDPPPQKGGGARQIFGPCLLGPNGWMAQDGTWHGGRPQPRRLCVR